jgi:hypothetical protein
MCGRSRHNNPFITRLDGVELFDPSFREPSYYEERMTEFDVVESAESRRYTEAVNKRVALACAKLKT